MVKIPEFNLSMLFNGIFNFFVGILTYKNGNKESISSHTKCNKKIHKPNEISNLNTDDIRVTSTVITVQLKTIAFFAFDLFVGCFVNLNLFIILSESCRLCSTHENSKNLDSRPQIQFQPIPSALSCKELLEHIR